MPSLIEARTWSRRRMRSSSASCVIICCTARAMPLRGPGSPCTEASFPLDDSLRICHDTKSSELFVQDRGISCGIISLKGGSVYREDGQAVHGGQQRRRRALLFLRPQVEPEVVGQQDGHQPSHGRLLLGAEQVGGDRPQRPHQQARQRRQHLLRGKYYPICLYLYLRDDMTSVQRMSNMSHCPFKQTLAWLAVRTAHTAQHVLMLP